MYEDLCNLNINRKLMTQAVELIANYTMSMNESEEDLQYCSRRTNLPLKELSKLINKSPNRRPPQIPEREWGRIVRNFTTAQANLKKALTETNLDVDTLRAAYRELSGMQEEAERAKKSWLKRT